MYFFIPLQQCFYRKKFSCVCTFRRKITQKFLGTRLFKFIKLRRSMPAAESRDGKCKKTYYIYQEGQCKHYNYGCNNRPAPFEKRQMDRKKNYPQKQKNCRIIVPCRSKIKSHKGKRGTRKSAARTRNARYCSEQAAPAYFRQYAHGGNDNHYRRCVNSRKKGYSFYFIIHFQNFTGFAFHISRA